MPEKKTLPAYLGEALSDFLVTLLQQRQTVFHIVEDVSIRSKSVHVYLSSPAPFPQQGGQTTPLPHA